MALPLNVYKAPTGIVSTSSTTIYTAPTGYTAVVLMGQVSNSGNSTERVTFSLVEGNEITPILPNAPVPSEDAVKFFSGKMFILSGNSIKLSGTNSSSLKYYLSILETLN